MSEKKTCCAKVYSPGSYRRLPCGKTAKFERDGEWYCGIHDPVRVEERRKARYEADLARWDAECAARKEKEAAAVEQERRAACYGELLAALEEIVGYAGGAETALDDEYVMERVHAAIAKAKGGEHV